MPEELVQEPYDGSFCENSEQLSAVDYLHKNLHRKAFTTFYSGKAISNIFRAILQYLKKWFKGL